MSIYVGNLDYSIDQEDLNEVFNEYGNVTRVHIPKDYDTGRKRGFAFVEMESNINEDKAISRRLALRGLPKAGAARSQFSIEQNGWDARLRSTKPDLATIEVHLLVTKTTTFNLFSSD